MTREQVKEILDRMSLEECIKMWNESVEITSSDKYRAIHKIEGDEWWDILCVKYGTSYIVGDIASSVKDRTFSQYDEYFFYNDCRFYSFSEKEDMMKILDAWFIEELMNREDSSTDRDKAVKRLKEMTFEECIKFCDSINCDHYERFVEIHRIDDKGWWDELAEEYGTWELINFVLSSGETFNDTDIYFFYNSEEDRIYSFSTKQELVELMTEDWFIEGLINTED
jgi:hypothetical protein